MDQASQYQVIISTTQSLMAIFAKCQHLEKWYHWRIKLFNCSLNNALSIIHYTQWQCTFLINSLKDDPVFIPKAKFFYIPKKVKQHSEKWSGCCAHNIILNAWIFYNSVCACMCGGGVVVWWCGGVVVWWCGGVVVWWCGGVVVCDVFGKEWQCFQICSKRQSFCLL